MEKQFKPVPDMECLKYHGTPEKPDIKIFVSHRIDMDSETIDNPLYIPVRCGAVYDEREGITMLGDDTGDNISEKRMSFCELTVQYWAWKNIKADYYGLCHYRRYLGFSKDKFPTAYSEANNGCVVEKFISDETIKKHHLSVDYMTDEIKKYDLIAMDPTILNGTTNYSAMQNSPDYHNMDDVDFAIDIIERKYPKMIRAVEKYMRHGEKCWLYNCWIMSAELFSLYNEWLFDVLFEIEKNVDYKFYSQQMYRTPGTLGERLFGIFITYLEMQKKYTIKYQQLVFWEETGKFVELRPRFSKNNIAIASNFNNNYAPIFSVLLQSIINHMSTKNNYDIIVFSMDITKKNKKILSSIANKSNVSLRFYNPGRYLYGMDLYVANAVYTQDMYVRVLIPHILSAYEKVLVLDADMICMTDIAELYMTDLGDYWAGAVKDVVYCGYLNGVVPGTLEYAKRTLRLFDPYSYCNSGVILFNCTKIRENFSLAYLQNYISTHEYRIYEQDTLNVLIDKHFYFLNRSWNMYTYTSDFIQKCIQYAPYTDKEEYLKAREHPGIIHYAAHPKPWWTGDGDFSVEFWAYARRTPYYEMILAEMIKKVAQQTGTCQPQYITPPYKSLPRKVADVLLPKGSRRRNLAKKILPKGSRRWNVLKKIYNRIMHIS